MIISLGQKTTVLIFLPVGITSWILIGISKNVTFLVLSRVLHGFAYGMLFSNSHLYIAEMSHTSVRWKLCTIVDLFRETGALYLALLGGSHLTWRMTSIICGVSTMVPPFIAIFFLPHSPRWLALKERYNEAIQSLTYYRGKKYDVHAEIADIKEDLQGSSGTKVIDQLKNLRANGVMSSFLTLLILHTFMFWSNITVVSYMVTIFQLTESKLSPYLSTIIAAIVKIIGFCLFLTISDRYSKKFFVITFTVISGLSLLSLGTYFYFDSIGQDVSSINWLPTVSLSLFNTFANIGFANVIVLRSELLPNSARAVGVATLHIVLTISSFFILYAYPYILLYLGPPWIYWIFGIISLIIAFIIKIFIPETKEKSLEEIQKMIRKETNNLQ